MNCIRILFLTFVALVFTGCVQSAKWADGDPGADAKARAHPRFRQGYLQARSDAAKAEYWAQERRERGGDTSGGRQVYYTLPGPAETADGVKLHPSQITVPIVE